MNKKLLALYGLKWNPFAPDVPVEALHVTQRIESFCWRVEQLIGEGGFALVTGTPGAGKSVTLRLLAEQLSGQRDIKVGVCSRPQANLADFYREMGDLFGIQKTSRWTPGITMVGDSDLNLNPAMPDGEYQLQLNVLDAQGNPVPGLDRDGNPTGPLPLGTVQVRS